MVGGEKARLPAHGRLVVLNGSKCAGPATLLIGGDDGLLSSWSPSSLVPFPFDSVMSTGGVLVGSVFVNTYTRPLYRRIAMTKAPVRPPNTPPTIAPTLEVDDEPVFDDGAETLADIWLLLFTGRPTMNRSVVKV